ncbi:MAG: YdiU family protein [Telmatospirillum sp.]|nr:YdiU family protein [Telmatospirillum sp.]
MLIFDNSYARLPDRFYTRMEPGRVAAPKLLRLNVPFARQLGLDPEWLASVEGVAMLAGAAMPEGAASIALVYAGHQFGHFSPQLGDGRALLVGEFTDPDGQRYDLHLKGSGRTPYSRGGDGRAAMGPVLREYVVSEAMAALGIPTTRTLAAVATGERVVREQILPGAVLARVAKSHIRVGTFEYFAARGDGEAVKALADYAIQRHDPAAANAAQPYRAFLDGVVARTADLIARWMAVGFIHGVMNTDNMSIAGETIDYGPCAFMDEYHPATVFSSIDHQGRYAYANQPRIAHWNMARLAQALAPLLGDDEDAAVASAQAAIDAFSGIFEDAYLARMRAKIGLATAQPDDASLIDGLLAAMANQKADFTLTFRHLAALLGDGPIPEGLEAWVPEWRKRLAAEGQVPSEIAARMDTVNPLYIPRNHLVEEALAAAEINGDLEPLDALLGAVTAPYAPQAHAARYAAPPLPHEIVEATFCGT